MSSSHSKSSKKSSHYYQAQSQTQHISTPKDKQQQNYYSVNSIKDHDDKENYIIQPQPQKEKSYRQQQSIRSQSNSSANSYMSTKTTITPNNNIKPSTMIDTIPIIPMSSEYQTLIYQSKIQILEDRLESLTEESDNVKKTNEILLSRIGEVTHLQKQLENELNKNIDLREQIEVLRERILDIELECKREVDALKDQLKGKDKFLELVKIQHNKQSLKKDEQIQHFRSIAKAKSSKLDNFQKQVYEMEFQRLKTDQRSSEKHNHSVSVNPRHRNLINSMVNDQNRQNSINTINKNGSRSRSRPGYDSGSVQVSGASQQKVKELMKRPKDELKVMMKSYKNAQRCLQVGEQQLTMIQHQRTILGTSTCRMNKTYYK